LRPFLLVPLSAILCVVASVAAAQPIAGPGVRDIVEFTNIVQPANQDDDALHDQVSPDGSSAFIVTRKADVASDTNRYEIQLLDLLPAHLAERRIPSPATVFSTAAIHDNSFGAPALQNVQWHDARRLVFLARLGTGTFQVYALDVLTRKLVQLTHDTNPIVSYAVSQDLRRVVYAAQVPNLPLHEGDHAVVVGNHSFWAVKFGTQNMVSQDWKFRYFLAETASSQFPRALGGAFPSSSRPLVSISPNGLWALLPELDASRLLEWKKRYPMIAELWEEYPTRPVALFHEFPEPAAASDDGLASGRRYGENRVGRAR
jgi:hypothetical protein